MLLFDEQLSQYLTELSLHLTESGEPAMAGPPHVTLTAAQQLDLPRIEAELESIAGSTSIFPIHFPVVGTFPGGEGVVFLNPTPTTALLQLQTRISDGFLLAGAQLSRRYRPGHWFPHCSLGINLVDPEVSLGLVRDAMNADFGGYADRLILVDTPNVTPIFEFNLSDD
jgi:hypothetical protein